MKKADYAILAAAIKRHGIERTEAPGVYYENAEVSAGAKQAAIAIAGTFARFASVDKTSFLKACGIE